MVFNAVLYEKPLSSVIIGTNILDLCWLDVMLYLPYVELYDRTEFQDHQKYKLETALQEILKRRLRTNPVLCLYCQIMI